MRTRACALPSVRTAGKANAFLFVVTSAHVHERKECKQVGVTCTMGFTGVPVAVLDDVYISAASKSSMVTW